MQDQSKPEFEEQSAVRVDWANAEQKKRAARRDDIAERLGLIGLIAILIAVVVFAEISDFKGPLLVDGLESTYRR